MGLFLPFLELSTRVLVRSMSTDSLTYLEIMHVLLCKRWWEVFHLAVGDEHDRNKQVNHCVCSLKSTLAFSLITFADCK